MLHPRAPAEQPDGDEPAVPPFNRAQQRDLLRRFTSHDVAPGTAIINEGDEGQGLFVLVSGEAEVERRGAGGGHPGDAAQRRGSASGCSRRQHDGHRDGDPPVDGAVLAREYVRIVTGVPKSGAT